ncbi:ankyrin repeat domain-containing protein [Flavobacterium sangjuense]|uniref:Uncharacterized protein n=1 Tax=Flavobacterium sangjuense TaxID=2518177 RepID=A0A4P7PWR2_9FLAO|nr:ankyrin repeat domain-containing protein [Flavobacterium sangjuense]QBZ98782.1 hypothetical protein GS03_02293 [Flavobacterium sangjuense]
MKKTILILFILSSLSFVHKDKWDDHKEGWTPLMLAIYNGNTKEFNKLIDKKADVTIRAKSPSEPLNALDIAVFKNNFKAVKKLVLTKRFKSLQGYFESSCAQGNRKIVDFFISKGVNVNRYSENGHSSLITACSTSSTEIVEILIKNGAELNHQRDVDGITGLMLAAFNGELKTVELLLKKGADKQIKDKNGERAYDYVNQIYPRLNVSEETKKQLKQLLE